MKSRIQILLTHCAKPHAWRDEWVADITKLSRFIRISKKGCWTWTGYGNRRSQPAFKSSHFSRLKGGDLKSRKYEEIYVRRFVLGLWDDTTSPHIRPTCKNKKCVSPSHLINLGQSLTLFPPDTKEALLLLLKSYPMAYLSRFYGISRYKLNRLKNDTL